ncbi:hypothetical protein PRIPAC_96199, partial [Pristionchus pacificus]|uniref:Uncharacterized protein n=1 Tax=Pristionchus pacificus TaxID=54126 RepID=A0A2A6B2Y7_PRIPA
MPAKNSIRVHIIRAVSFRSHIRLVILIVEHHRHVLVRFSLGRIDLILGLFLLFVDRDDIGDSIHRVVVDIVGFLFLDLHLDLMDYWLVPVDADVHQNVDIPSAVGIRVSTGLLKEGIIVTAIRPRLHPTPLDSLHLRLSRQRTLLAVITERFLYCGVFIEFCLLKTKYYLLHAALFDEFLQFVVLLIGNRIVIIRFIMHGGLDGRERVPKCFSVIFHSFSERSFSLTSGRSASSSARRVSITAEWEWADKSVFAFQTLDMALDPEFLQTETASRRTSMSDVPDLLNLLRFLLLSFLLWLRKLRFLEFLLLLLRWNTAMRQ